MNIMVGADPELFLRKGRRLVSAISLINGTKRAPLKTSHGAIQWDNILAEYNINPANTAEQFVVNNTSVLEDLRKHIGDAYTLDFGAAYWAPATLLMDPRTLIAGCTPDFNAWENGAQNDPPNYRETRLRSAGGHIHISADGIGTDYLARLNLVRLCDVFIGLPGVLLGDKTDNLRRSVYGKAGAFRPKYLSKDDPYDGVEYRASSNWWLRKPEYMTLAFEGAKEAVSKLYDSKLQATLFVKGWDIRDTINKGNKKQAEELLKYFSRS
jgi:Phage phiEco32-like COOH.NH2 ligase-type 2